MNMKRKSHWASSPIAICIVGLIALFFVLANLSFRATEANADGKTAGRTATFSNSTPIAPADRASNDVGSNPGLPASNYPSEIAVSGLVGAITKVTVTFAVTSTNPDDLDILLVGPEGQRSLVMSDAGGAGDVTNVTYTFDQTNNSHGPMSDDPTLPPVAGTYWPTNHSGLLITEPQGNDNFPTVNGLNSYGVGFNTFKGRNPNGIWKLYVVDDQSQNINSLPSGWSINITTAEAAMDFDGDSVTDYVVIRNTGGPGGQVTWFITNSSDGSVRGYEWGLSTDVFFAEDFDGDQKDDIAVWRPDAATLAAFYILNSSGFTVRVEAFGQINDDPTVVGDYDGDEKADLAVYRDGALPGQQSYWYYRTVENGPVTIRAWGQHGDQPVPGDYDGNGTTDICVRRTTGTQGAFWSYSRTITGGTDPLLFGAPNDIVVPGDYDGDGKTDLAVAHRSFQTLQWWYRSSGNNGAVSGPITFGHGTNDMPVPGDYDGDGRADIAIWRNGMFWVRRSGLGGSVSTFQFGTSGDYPVANFNAH